METQKISISKHIANNIWFEDEIMPIGNNMNDIISATRLNFLLCASDDVYIWAGCYKNKKEMEAYSGTDGYYNIYIDYDTASGKAYLETVGHDDVPNPDVEGAEIVGEGLNVLIRKMERYCQSLHGKTASEFLADYNSWE